MYNILQWHSMMQIINFTLDFATIFQKLKVERPHTLNMQCWLFKSLYFWVKKKKRKKEKELALTPQDEQGQSSWQQHVTSCCLCASLQARGRKCYRQLCEWFHKGSPLRVSITFSTSVVYTDVCMCVYVWIPQCLSV